MKPPTLPLSPEIQKLALSLVRNLLALLRILDGIAILSFTADVSKAMQQNTITIEEANLFLRLIGIQHPTPEHREALFEKLMVPNDQASPVRLQVSILTRLRSDLCKAVMRRAEYEVRKERQLELFPYGWRAEEPPIRVEQPLASGDDRRKTAEEWLGETAWNELRQGTVTDLDTVKLTDKDIAEYILENSSERLLEIAVNPDTLPMLFEALTELKDAGLPPVQEQLLERLEDGYSTTDACNLVHNGRSAHNALRQKLMRRLKRRAA